MTLIEIMIVVVIMALVATGVGMAVLPQLENAKIKQTTGDVQAVRSAVMLYLTTHDTSSCPSMQELVDEKMIDASTSTQDPWKHEFVIACDGAEISVRSAGPDGELETADDIPKRKG